MILEPNSLLILLLIFALISLFIYTDLANLIKLSPKSLFLSHSLISSSIFHNSAFISERSYIGGSFVNVSNLSPKKEKYGTAIDIAYFYKLKYKTKLIESISIGVGVFHPTTWKPKQYFLPTYSIDIKFK